MDDHGVVGKLGERQLGRRGFMKGLGAGAALAGSASLLAACDSGVGAHAKPLRPGDDPFSAYAATKGNPSRGGTLRIGYIGAGNAETYNPFVQPAPISQLQTFAVFDPMIRVGESGGREPGLIIDWQSNREATEWELTLRPDVRWHDGKPFTPEDVIYSLRQLKSSWVSTAVESVRLDELKKTGNYTVRVPLSTPIADLPGYFFFAPTTFIVQDGTKDYSKPIGTGPYKLESFTPGQRSVFTANRDYWDSPRPYPDRLEIIGITDPTARLNALIGGQIDICGQLPFAVAKGNLNNSQYKVIVGSPGQQYVMYMRCDSGPFQDLRVRQAMKLIPDRQAMIDSALSGFGSVANDIFCLPGSKYFDTSLPQRAQDLAQAKSLLKAAGVPDLEITLNTAESVTGFNAAAEVFAQQAKAAGVKVRVNVQQPAQYFDPSVLYLKQTFAQDIWPGPSLLNNYSLALLKDSVLNESHFFDDDFDRLFSRARGETDPALAQQLWNQVQEIQYNKGGNLGWAYARNVDAVSNNVRGFGGKGQGWLYQTDDCRVWNWGLA